MIFHVSVWRLTVHAYLIFGYLSLRVRIPLAKSIIRGLIALHNYYVLPTHLSIHFLLLLILNLDFVQISNSKFCYLPILNQSLLRWHLTPLGLFV